MRRVLNVRGRVSVALVSAGFVSALICAVGMMPLRAQNTGTRNTGTLTGTVLDQATRAMSGATITAKSESGSVSGTATSDNEGKFSIGGLAAGNYTVETTAAGFALNTRRDVQVPGTQDLSITLNVDAISQSVTVQETVLLAEESSPISTPLDVVSPKTTITTAVIKDFMAPVADFAEVLQQAPGTFSYNPNGIGLGQGKTFFRGFPDGDYTMQFDGIPFEDTNSPTHHSWASFPSQWISSTDFDRSPGEASDFGPTNFGGIIDLKSPELQADPDIRGTFSYGSFNTKLYSLDFDSGLLGHMKQDAVLFNVNAMTSAGYQTNNFQQRDAGYGKYQRRFNDRTTLTLYGGVVDIWNHTPNTTNPTRAQVADYGVNYLLDATPTCTTVTLTCPVANGSPDPYYYGYDTYHVQTDFEYAHYNADLGNGWKLDNNAYTTRYWNKQFYQNGATVNLSTSGPSGVDKLNGYRHAGDTFSVSKESKWGVFTSGAWYDWAYTDRYQYPSNILTQEDTPLPNFHEHFITQTFQPFAQYEWHPLRKLVFVAGIKAADYRMTLNQYQDNQQSKAVKTSGIVGCLGGTISYYPATAGIWAGAPECLGGAAFVTHSQNWNNWLPSVAARYRLWRQWSAYAQFGEGSIIPPSAAFDVPGGNVLTPLKPATAKTYQVGSVIKLNRFTFDWDAYYVHFQNGYHSYTHPTTGEAVFSLTGPTNTKGTEAEGNVALGYGFSLYANASFGSAKYQTGPYPNSGLWVANTPTNIEGVSVLWQHRNYDMGLVYKHVGSYWQDNATLTSPGYSIAYPVDQIYQIQPWDLLNVFLNYTMKNTSHLRGSKIQFAVNNLANSHSLVGLTPGVKPTVAVLYAQSPLDQLNLLPGRSFSITLTGGYAPQR
jgi:iron complex outermembrane receptor protein